MCAKKGRNGRKMYLIHKSIQQCQLTGVISPMQLYVKLNRDFHCRWMQNANHYLSVCRVSLSNFQFLIVHKTICDNYKKKIHHSKLLKKFQLKLRLELIAWACLPPICANLSRSMQFRPQNRSVAHAHRPRFANRRQARPRN